MESLKTLVKKTLISEVFRDRRRPKHPNPKGEHQFAWAVLVVNSSTLRIVQSCLQTHELTAENIARIDLIEETNKRPPTNLHAIYFLSPVSKFI